MKDLLANPPPKEDDKRTEPKRSRKEKRPRERAYDILTVDQAVARFGVSRAEVMAAFEKATVPFEVTLK